MENQNEIQQQEQERLVLRTEHLVKIYGKRTVVNDVSFDVKQGEIVGLLGPNGAGKTTSFYMTTGLIVPNGGHIFLGDEDVTTYPVYRRARAGIGYLAQEASVFRKMTVEDNILSVLEMTGKPRDYQLEKLESLIKEFRLEKVRKNLGDRLSGGERRRTEIARCLAIEPKFIMLDEPFAGVDPIAVEDIQFIVWKLKDKNIGILITDHNVEDTLCITNRAYLLFEGRILFQGSPEELAANPVVRKNYLTESFVLRQKDFSALEEQRKAEEEAERKSLIPLNQYLEQTVFTRAHVDWECTTIGREVYALDREVKKNIDRGQSHEALLLFLQIVKSMCRHFISDEHWGMFDDVYDPDYSCMRMVDTLNNAYRSGKFTQADLDFFHEAWKEIEQMEAVWNYGMANYKFEF